MPRQPSPSVRTTLYRLNNVGELTDAVRSKYLDAATFTSTTAKIGDREALAVTGWMSTEQVAWAASLRELTGEEFDVGHQTAAGVLVIRDGKESAWALSYGMGFQLLDQDHIDAAFGQRIAIRVADPNGLSSLTRSALDQRARVDRSSIPSGDHLRGFGFGEFGELVTRLVGKARIEGLTAPDETLRIRGADALSVPLGRKPDSLLNDLDVLTRVLEQPVVDGLEPLEQLTMVKHNPGLIATLEEHLEDAIESSDTAMIGLAWPHEQVDENGVPNAFKVYGAGRTDADPRDSVPSLGDLLGVLRQVPKGQRGDRARRVKVQLLSDAGSADSAALSSAIPIRKWIAFEATLQSHRYFLHNGNWYLMDQSYAEKLRRQTKGILSVPARLTMPEWPEGMVESEYNRIAADELGGLLLDRKLLRTALHNRGIETCDILLPDGTLIHVKRIRASDAASHHIAQALVSAEALMYDDDARQGFAHLIANQGGDPDWRPDRVKRVVLAMARPGPITEDTMLTFSQVTLVRCAGSLRARGIEVCVAPIRLVPRSTR